MNGKTCRYSCHREQTCGASPVEGQRGQISHVWPGRQFKKQDCKDKLGQVTPALPARDETADATPSSQTSQGREICGCGRKPDHSAGTTISCDVEIHLHCWCCPLFELTQTNGT